MIISSVGYNSILHEFVSYENNWQQSKVLYRFRLGVQALISALFTFTLSVDSYEACLDIKLLHCSKILHFLVHSITFPQAHICYWYVFLAVSICTLQNMNQLLDQSLFVRSIKRLLGGTESKSLYHPKELVSIKHLPS